MQQSIQKAEPKMTKSSCSHFYLAQLLLVFTIQQQHVKITLLKTESCCINHYEICVFEQVLYHQNKNDSHSYILCSYFVFYLPVFVYMNSATK